MKSNFYGQTLFYRDFKKKFTTPSLLDFNANFFRASYEPVSLPVYGKQCASYLRFQFLTLRASEDRECARALQKGVFTNLCLANL